VSLLPPINLSDADKLLTLQRLDQFRRWRSLDEKRYCLGCGKIITGWQIEVIGGTRGTGPLRIICPTRRCNSIPMDWVLLTDEILAKISPLNIKRTDVPPSRLGLGKNSIASRLRKFAVRLKRTA
jgi:hypothetical protein